MTERIIFFFRFILQPAKIGSITPSSAYLAKRMLNCLPWSELEMIVELGAGTGVFTQFIAEHKQQMCQVVVVEQDGTMRRELQQHYPSFFFGSKAEQLTELMQNYHLEQADCIVSGLPFTAFSGDLREAVLDSVQRSLKPGGLFVAFQYTLHMRQEMESHFREVEIGFALFNIPPAFIYFCRK